ncbi:MAG: hypothetical protein GY757_00725 [bacterium]|nr:hypothetical protein [bacterium]
MKRKTKNDYDCKPAAFRAIGDKQIKKPHNIPVSIYIQEADTLYPSHIAGGGVETPGEIARKRIDNDSLVGDLAVEADQVLLGTRAMSPGNGFTVLRMSCRTQNLVYS